MEVGLKNIANYISIARIFMTILLIFVPPMTTTFLIIYLSCCISDILDGLIARRTNTVTEIGSKLDSIADFLFVILVFIKLIPLLKLSTYIVVWIALIFVIRFASIVIIYVKHNTLAILHTYSNKATGFILIFIPILMYFANTVILAVITCSIATLSSVEEMIVNLTSAKLNTDKKGLFY